MYYLNNLGVFPRYLSSIKPLPCLDCLLRKSQKKLQHSKAPLHFIRNISDISSSSVSVDKIISSAPRIKPQSVGRLTKATIVSLQVFADYLSSLPFLCTYLMENFSEDKSLKAKISFKRIATTFNNSILYYRSNNRHFSGDCFC